MPSATARPASLIRRVVWSSAMAAALGGVIAASAGGLATINLVDEHEEQVLLESTKRLAEEVEEEEQEDGETLADALADELGDVDYVGTIGAIRAGGRLLAGDDQLPTQAVGECAHVELGNVPYRACTVAHGGREVTLAVNVSYAKTQRPLFLGATVVGILVGIGAGVLLGRAATRWGLDPFVQLRDRVQRVRPEAPDPAVLEPPAQYSELEDLRRAVANLVGRLGDSLAQAQRFAAQASHELRTPLTAIAGELELLSENAPASDAVALAAVSARVESMTRLVQRLLVLSTPFPSDIGEAVDLADVAAEAVAKLPSDDRTRVGVEVAEDILVKGDTTLLAAALSNAIDNALKFSRDRVDVRITGTRTEAWMEVIDSGPGISPDERDRVFEPFYRAPAARSAGVRGSGIGLALIAHVVEGHNGRAEFASVPKGTCLRIVLPRWSASTP
jgi:two-component system, OmpR family, sensor kinase